MRRLALLLSCCLLLASCSSLELAYNQAARLTAWWLDRQFDLDRRQRDQLDQALAELHAWHRREELPHWQALLQAALRGLDDGRVDAAELQALEQRLDESLQRTLRRTAPLAAPWLATLRPEQWQHYSERRREHLQEWRAEEADADQRADALKDSLERWLGRLERPLRTAAERQAQSWGPAPAALWQERAQRQAWTEQGLRTWAAGDLEAGTRLLLMGGARLPEARGPATQAQRERTYADLPVLLQQASPAQWQRARERWRGWLLDLEQLRADS
ncbi:DUF6279 family lipoprotein [Inhella sp.]|uniref:DUF6279 family lipoprotein n=1 Tax=Inhella sp. TaxID=1921806 RepID=UPI0035B31935